MLFQKTETTQPKKWHLVFFAIVILLAIGLKLYGHYWPKAEVMIKGHILKVLVADTAEHRFRGWSNKKDMGKYDGMLFVFDTKGQHTIVMREMNFPLDIIWLDGFKIVDMAPSVPPQKGVTETDLVPYFARLPSTLVLELPAGFIVANELKIGDSIEILK